MAEEQKSDDNNQENNELVATTFVGENKLLVWTEQEKAARQQELLDKSAAFSPFTGRTDEYRDQTAYPSGGFMLADADQTSLLRSAATEIISIAGRKIMSGDFNLTKISFPIRCMQPQSSLMQCTAFASTLPIYMNKAASTTDPVERMKLVMTSNFSWQFYNQLFAKPLNPILGETYQAQGQDGTQLFLEQTCHHPPRSHFIAIGPNENFTYTGWLEYEIYLGLQTSTVNCHGHKQVKFKDGTLIRWNHNNDYLHGIFLGTMGHQMQGKVTFTDEANNITGFYQYNAYMFSKQDFCWGELHQNGEKICELIGNYTGYLDFAGVRYWDVREKDEIYFPIAGETPDSLPSQASKRTDGRFFISKPLEEAQAEKERLENLQRHDRKLREQAAERRANGGPKFKPSTTDEEGKAAE